MAKSPKKASTGKNGDGAGKVSKKSRIPAGGVEGDCNPCFEKPVGVLVCDGQNPAVHSPPLSGGPWALVWRNDTFPQGWDWHNLGGARSAEEGTSETASEPAPEPQPPEGG